MRFHVTLVTSTRCLSHAARAVALYIGMDPVDDLNGIMSSGIPTVYVALAILLKFLI